MKEQSSLQLALELGGVRVSKAKVQSYFGVGKAAKACFLCSTAV